MDSSYIRGTIAIYRTVSMRSDFASKAQFSLVHLKDRYITRVVDIANATFLFVYIGCTGVDVLWFHC